MNISMLYRTALLSLICALTCAGVSAKRYEVSDAKEIAALKTLQAGDTVVMRSGEWADQQIQLRGDGREGAPVVLMAESAGATILTGGSKLQFSGDWIVVSGLRFKDIKLDSDAVISFRTGSGRLANNSVLKDCAITGHGLQKDLTDYKWVSVYGSNNTVEKCSFMEKKNMGTLLVVWLEEGRQAKHTIRNNYFSRPMSMLGEGGKTLNGQETLRIGTSTVSMTTASCVVEGNYFYRCNGEVEIVSNKSCGNVYRNNVFNECEGTLTLRHGNDCEVYANAFFGGGVKGTGGVRIIGERHRVYNNYFQDLMGTGYYSAITAVQGEKDPVLSGYFTAKDCQIVNNTVVNCAWGININHGSTRQTKPVENLTVASNVMVNYNDPKANNIIIRLTPEEPVGMVWENNISHGGRFKDTDAKETASLDINPDIRTYKGFWLPFAKTALNKHTVKGFDFVTVDYFGTARDMGASVRGAFEMVKKPDMTDIPSRTNRGVTWKL